MAKRVIILGGTGMLGAMVADVLSRSGAFQIVATVRGGNSNAVLDSGEISTLELDAGNATTADCRRIIDGADWVINCIGITKPLIADDDRKKVERAIRVNSVFPHELADAAGEAGTRVLQIATDCVYSGTRGDYIESDRHDALDVYGKTKSLGEVQEKNFFNLRASIVGPEPKDPKFLLEWFLGQPKGASVNGFENHEWNGVTTLHFAKVVQGILRKDLALPVVHHLVPTDRLTKAEMLRAFARAYGRDDMKINNIMAGQRIDRTLKTRDPGLNADLWAAAGYDEAPSVGQMIEELAGFPARFGRAAPAIAG